MNLGLTGPLNPLRPGNAALGAQPLARRPRSEGRRPGSGVFCCSGPDCGLGWQGRAPGVWRDGAPSSSPSLVLSFCAQDVRLCTFLFGRRAWPGSSGAGGGNCSVGPGGRRLPGVFPARRAPPDPERDPGLRDWGRRPWRWARCAVPALRSDPGPHTVPR